MFKAVGDVKFIAVLLFDKCKNLLVFAKSKVMNFYRNAAEEYLCTRSFEELHHFWQNLLTLTNVNV